MGGESEEYKKLACSLKSGLSMGLVPLGCASCCCCCLVRMNGILMEAVEEDDDDEMDENEELPVFGFVLDLSRHSINKLKIGDADLDIFY